jgi:hypothetical protein
MPGCGVGEGNVSKFKCETGRRGREKLVRGREEKNMEEKEADIITSAIF